MGALTVHFPFISSLFPVYYTLDCWRNASPIALTTGEAIENQTRLLVIDEKEERHHGKTEPILKKEVRQILRLSGINGKRLKYATNKEPVIVKGKRTRHLFDMSVQVNHHRDFIRCISFDVEHYVVKLDAAKVLVYDTKDIKEANQRAEVVSILYPPKVHGGKKPQGLFKEAQLILNDEGIPSFNFDSQQDRKRLIERINPPSEE